MCIRNRFAITGNPTGFGLRQPSGALAQPLDQARKLASTDFSDFSMFWEKSGRGLPQSKTLRVRPGDEEEIAARCACPTTDSCAQTQLDPAAPKVMFGMKDPLYMTTQPKADRGVTAKDAKRAEKQTDALEHGKGIPFFARQVAKKLLTPSKIKPVKPND